MKRLSFVPLVLAVSLLTTIAFAAVERKAGSFGDLAGSGVQGKVDLMAAPQDLTSIHGSARNLQPGTEYAVIWYRNTSCSPELSTQVVDTFKGNPSGIASFQGKVQIPLSEINSVGIVRTSDQILVACAPVTTQ